MEMWRANFVCLSCAGTLLRFSRRLENYAGELQLLHGNILALQGLIEPYVIYILFHRVVGDIFC